MAMTRLKGLNLRTFLKEMLRRENADVDHFEGTFRYPRYGIGMIAEKLGEACGRENIRTRAKVTKISHGDGRVQTVTVNGAQEIAIEDVISTLPLPYFLEIMDPPPDENILALARGLHYRSLILVAFFLRKGMVSPSAAVYFPGPEFIFTRAYEPRNRSPFMSPPGKTSLVVEIPCNLGDDYWKTEDDRLIELVLSQLSETGWVKPDEIIDSRVKRMEYAYPVLEVGTEEKTQRMLDFLRGFENLQIAGRNGRFTYTSIHEVLRLSREIVAEYVA
jgi:protoporphyrinogen oxidase